MVRRGIANKVLGGILVLLGVLFCIVGLFPAIMMAWEVWQDGGPDFIMMGSWDLTVPHFFLLCGVVFVIGATLFGVGIQLFFRASRRD